MANLSFIGCRGIRESGNISRVRAEELQLVVRSLMCTITPQWACSQAGPSPVAYSIAPISILVTPWDRCLVVGGPCYLVTPVHHTGKGFGCHHPGFLPLLLPCPLWVGGRNTTVNWVPLSLDQSRAVCLPHRNQPLCRWQWRMQPSVLLHPSCHQVRLPHRPGAVE